MAATDRMAKRWQARWGKRENKRRRTAYESAVREWRRRDDELRQISTQAQEPAVPPVTPAGLPVSPDEVVLAVQPAAELIDVTARHIAGLPAPELTVIPVKDTGRVPRPPKGLVVVDTGFAVITDRRLILVGRAGTREWPYARLAGVAHHPELPVSLLHSRGGGKIQGIGVPSTIASAFRLRLTLAYAETTGKRDALLNRLDDAVEAHWDSRPETPATATPTDAPAARLARPALVAAVAVAVALAVAGAVGWSGPDRPLPAPGVAGGVRAEPPDLAEPSPSGGPGALVNSTPRTIGPAPGSSPGAPVPTSGPAVPGTPRPTGGGSVATPPGPPAPSTPGGPGPSPSAASPTPSTGDRCGAPENPYGYNYCGGSYVEDPATDVCSYFDCVATFWNGKGYMVQCQDGLVSMTGVQRGPCAGHGGTRRPAYV